jgi:integrase
MLTFWPISTFAFLEPKTTFRALLRAHAKLENIFNDNFSRYRWKKIRYKPGLDDFKFHDLRKTFGSVLAQNGVSTAVIQKLLEHSSPDLTNKVYTNVDPVLRHAVDQIPVGDWL